MNKKKLAIFDLTDCEGCELQIINLREKILDISDMFSIVNWRMVSESTNQGPYDIAIIEGNPVKPDEVKLIKKLRVQSKIIIALGACAVTGGIPSMIDEKKRKVLTARVYNKDYKPKAKLASPLSKYINIDYNIPGCPADKNQIEKILINLYYGKPPKPTKYPVCLECKQKENTCLLLEGKPCLGPVTEGGCGAVCPSGGLHCYGCFGPVKDANLTALKNVFSRDLFMTSEDTKKQLELFWKDLEEFNKFHKD